MVTEAKKRTRRPVAKAAIPPVKPVQIPPNGTHLGLYTSMARARELVESVNTSICIVRRSMAAEVAGGNDFRSYEEPRQHMGDPELYEGVMAGSYPPELREALVMLSRNHCLRQMIRVGEIFDHLGRTPEAACNGCDPKEQ